MKDTQRRRGQTNDNVMRTQRERFLQQMVEITTKKGLGRGQWREGHEFICVNEPEVRPLAGLSC